MTQNNNFQIYIYFLDVRIAAMDEENSEKSATEHATCAANTKMERSENFFTIQNYRSLSFYCTTFPFEN